MINRSRIGWLVSSIILIAHLANAQQAKQRYASLQQAVFSGGQLSGSAGPRSVNWIEDGTKFSFLDGQRTIKTLSPKDQKEEIVLGVAS